MSRALTVSVIVCALVAGLTVPILVRAQAPDEPYEPPPPPPPSRSREQTEDEKKARGIRNLEEDLISDSTENWGLPDDLLSSLATRALDYKAYTRRFLCTETARLAEYKNGEASKEKTRTYSYLLIDEPSSYAFTESRRAMTAKGNVKKDEVKDEEPFPPAYAWVFLFSKKNQPYISYRDMGDYFDGFDWVRRIEFRGAVPFSDGKDIRQWEGTVTVDAVNHILMEIQAEPSAQRERIRAEFEKWSRSFNIAGLRVAPRPLGYRCRVEFRHRAEGLNFPTRLRYDTFRAVGYREIVPTQASSRVYSDYRIIRVETEQTVESPGSDPG